MADEKPGCMHARRRALLRSLIHARKIVSHREGNVHRKQLASHGEIQNGRCAPVERHSPDQSALSSFFSTGMFMAKAVPSITIIAFRVLPPIAVVPFPSVKTVQPERIANQPDIAGAEIETLIANETHVFEAIPHVSIRNHRGLDHNGPGRGSNDYRRRGRYDNQRLKPDSAVGIDHTTGCQNQTG
jgi:hypothetical protein